MRALLRLGQSIKSPAPAQRTSPRPRDQNALFPFVLISHSRAPVHEDLPGCRQSVLHAQAYDQLSPPNSQMIRMIGNGIPISQSNNPRPMVRSIMPNEICPHITVQGGWGFPARHSGSPVKPGYIQGCRGITCWIPIRAPRARNDKEV